MWSFGNRTHVEKGRKPDRYGEAKVMGQEMIQKHNEEN